MEIRISPDRTLVALRTGPTVTAGEWFVYHPDQGGGYTDGVQQGVVDWALVLLIESGDDEV